MSFLLATSTVADGNMSFVLGGEKAFQNRNRFLEKNGFPLEYVYAELEHGDVVAVVDKTKKRESIKADALITSAPGMPLIFVTADCFPLVYHDLARNVIALAHLGWKSSELGLAGKVVREMQKLGSQPEDIRAFIGPGIHKESYLIENPAQKNNPAWQEFLAPAEGGRTSVDLIGFNKKVLADAGVREKNIEVSSVDTAVSSEYFSHRRASQTSEPEGRFATVVMLQ